MRIGALDIHCRVALELGEGGDGGVAKPRLVDEDDARAEDAAVLRQLRHRDARVEQPEEQGRRDRKRVERAGHLKLRIHDADGSDGERVVDEGDEQNDDVELEAVVLDAPAALVLVLVLSDQPLVDGVAEVDEDDQLVQQEERRDKTRDPGVVGEEVVGGEDRAGEDARKERELEEPVAAVQPGRALATTGGCNGQEEEDTGKRERDAVDGPVALAVVTVADGECDRRAVARGAVADAYARSADAEVEPDIQIDATVPHGHARDRGDYDEKNIQQVGQPWRGEALTAARSTASGHRRRADART